jgi:hypothetical protein
MSSFRGFILGSLLGLLLLTPSCHTPTQVPLPISYLLSAGLKTESPKHFPRIVVITAGTNSYPIEHLDLLLFLFYNEWINTFEDPKNQLLDSLWDLVIVWEENVWILEGMGFDEQGKEIKNPRIIGLTQNKNLIRVAANRSPITHSSLVHELIHVVLWHTDPSSRGDPDHEGEIYPGWTLKHSAFEDALNQLVSTML